MLKPYNSSVAYYVVDKSCATLSSYIYISYLTATDEQDRISLEVSIQALSKRYLA